MPKEDLDALAGDIGKNWLAGDGIWFQAVERAYGMNDAKRCNDSCWGHFSPFEAWSIKRFLGLGERPGLEGLRKALRFRMYALINVQSIVDDGPGSIIFRMNDCRVQSARKRKGLADYPCKSAGLVEYTRFAEAIDPRIKTECVGCPPDTHPDECSAPGDSRFPELLQNHALAGADTHLQINRIPHQPYKLMFHFTDRTPLSIPAKCRHPGP
jgi:hypothetical protein